MACALMTSSPAHGSCAAGRGLQWKDAPKDHGPHKTLYSHFRRWTELGVFDRIFSDLAAGDRRAE
jgi:transposase